MCYIKQNITIVTFLLILVFSVLKTNAQSADDIPFSFMFIIDNSASNGRSGTDTQGERFTISKRLFDYIYERDPKSKIGLVIFGSRLWFYGPDDTALFVSDPGDQYFDGNGCYIPPLNLNEIYSGIAYGFEMDTIEYSKTGHEVLKMYLETKEDKGTINKAIIPRYEPTHRAQYPYIISHNSRLTNITRAFIAANQAHLYQQPELEKSKHINIFLSDGMAGLDAYSPDYSILNNYIQGNETPSTITFFYNPNPNDLAALNTMTDNIKNNEYSENNSKITDIFSLFNYDVAQGKIKELYDALQTKSKSSFVLSKNNDVSISRISSKEYMIQTTQDNLRVDIYNANGKKIRSLNSLSKQQSNCKVIWNIHDNSSRKIAVGRYFLKIRYGKNHICKSLTIY